MEGGTTEQFLRKGTKQKSYSYATNSLGHGEKNRAKLFRHAWETYSKMA
jgi:hypothetical protein